MKMRKAKKEDFKEYLKLKKEEEKDLTGNTLNTYPLAIKLRK